MTRPRRRSVHDGDMVRQTAARRVRELGEQLRGLLAAIDADELTASAEMRHRIEGAVVALAILDGAAVDDLAERFR